MIKLFVGDEKGEVQDATVPVRWCVDKETRNIKGRKGKKTIHSIGNSVQR